MKKIILLLFYALFAALGAYSQTTYSGKVVDAQDKKAIAGAQVLLLSPRDSTMLSYGFSEEDGSFSIELNKPEVELLLAVQSLGYKRKYQKVVAGKPLTVMLSATETKLREVVVRTPKVWGSRDTLHYSVARLGRLGDKTIGDVIRHIPGVRVGENGTIEYQGKPISRLMVEGMDLSQGRYQQLTKSISALDISSVQILNNDQRIKSLVGVRSSDDISFNLKLSPKVKGLFSGVADLSLGYDGGLLSQSKVSLNYLMPTRQHLLITSFDNTGHDISQELTDYSTERIYGSSQRLSNAMALYSLNRHKLPEHHYLDNTSFYTSYSNALRLKDSSELKLQAYYYYDKNREQRQTFTHYRSEGGRSLDYSELFMGKLRREQLTATADYEKNHSKFYIKDKLQLSFTRGKDEGAVSQDGYRIPLSLWGKGLFVRNDFRYLLPQGSIPIELITSQQLSHRVDRFCNGNQALGQTIPQLFFGGELSQKVQQRQFFSYNTLQIPDVKIFGGWRYTPGVRLHYRYTHFSRLLMEDEASLSDSYFLLSALNRLERMVRNIVVSLELPIGYQVRKLNHQPDRLEDRRSSLYWMGLARMKADLGSHWKFQLDGIFNQGQPDMLSFLRSPLMTDYRSLEEGEGKLYEVEMVGGSAKLTFQDIFAFLSTSLSASFRQDSQPYIYSNYSEAGYKRLSLIPYKHMNNFYHIQWSLSKGFTLMNSSLDLDVSYDEGHSWVAYRSEILPYKNKQWGLRAKLVCTPIRKLVLTDESKLVLSRSSMAGEEQSRTQLWRNELMLDLSCTSNLYLRNKLETTLLKGMDHRSDVSLWGMSLNYRWGGANFSLSLENILDRKSYTSLWQYEYGYYMEELPLRGRTILLNARFNL